MKKILIPIFVAVLVAGCGGSDQAKNTTDKEFQGVRAEQDYVAKGMEYLAESDIPSAIHSFDMAIKQDPTDVENYIVLGQVYLRLQQYGRAGDTFQAATRVEPTNGELYYLVAMARGLEGEKDIAIESAQKSVELFMAQKDEERFKQSVALLKGLTDSQNAPEQEADAVSETASSMQKTVEEDVQNVP